ncbi:hypothetical protein [Sporosarcina newyorkensis]|uniref:hypothetical protein n=1 Tax=Sporosarcina newyorkensis TaxID=759851 RepID=UPI003CFF5F01
MVRRRGIYEVEILGKQLCCTLCDGKMFHHREIYLDLELPKKIDREQLTLQSLMCKVCSTTQLVQEKTDGTKTNIVYIEVKT